MDIDMEYAIEVLKQIRNVYPKPANFMAWERHVENRDKFVAVINYLYGHQMIDNRIETNINGEYIFTGIVTITERGIDFLRADGGLTALLDITTIKFHPDDLNLILQNAINSSDSTPAQKQTMRDALKQLPAESIKHLTMTLLDKGVSALPGLLPLIQTFLR